MEKPVTISIVIVNYNAVSMLDNCLSSIYENTTGVSYEIIVVENGSKADIKHIVLKYRDVKFIFNENNMGFAHANNQAFSLVKGKYTLILNNDTVFIENTLGIALRYMDEQLENLFVGCKLLNEDRTLQISVSQFPTVLNTFSANFLLYAIFSKSKRMNKFYLSHYDISDPTEVDIVYGAFILCRTSRLKELNGFDERFYFYSEEMDLCKRHQTLGGRVVYFPKTAIIHLGGQTTKSMPWFKYKNQAISYVQIYQKYFTGWRFLSVITFHYVGLVIRVPIFVLLGIVTFSKQHFVRAYYNFKQIFIYPKNLFKS